MRNIPTRLKLVTILITSTTFSFYNVGKVPFLRQSVNPYEDWPDNGRYTPADIDSSHGDAPTYPNASSGSSNHTIPSSTALHAGQKSSSPSTIRNEEGRMNILLYITTLYSDQHFAFLECCWPTLMERSELLPKMHVTVFSNNETTVPEDRIDHVRHLFRSNPTLNFEYAPLAEIQKIKKQRIIKWNQAGANLAMELAFRNNWFLLDQKNTYYDWIIRINPDVLIRNSSWIVEKMRNPDIDGIFVKCRHDQLHTDFFAVRPEVVVTNHRQFEYEQIQNDSTHERKPFSTMVKGNAEKTAYQSFRPILDSGRFALLPDAPPTNGRCRIEAPSVWHSHDIGNAHSCLGSVASNASFQSVETSCYALAGWNIH